MGKMQLFNKYSKNEKNDLFGFSKRLDKHRVGLIELYEDQIQDAGPFMTIVLEEALRKLKETELDPKRIENWVIRLEKSWRVI